MLPIAQPHQRMNKLSVNKNMLVTLMITQRIIQKLYFKYYEICSFSQMSVSQHFSHPMAAHTTVGSKQTCNFLLSQATDSASHNGKSVSSITLNFVETCSPSPFPCPLCAHLCAAWLDSLQTLLSIKEEILFFLSSLTFFLLS